MQRLLAAGALVLALAAGSVAGAQTAGNSGTMPATPAMPAIPNGPGEPATPAIPATPGIPADSPAAAALPPGTPTMIDNTLPPPPPSSLNKTYPVCTRRMQDNCQNPGEGGAPGRNRATHARHHRP